MDVYLNKSIKEVLTEFPQVEGILSEYGIGCGPCIVGTCLLKDMVDVHGLSPEAEREMMARIAKVVSPDREIQLPEIKRKPEIRPRELKYSPPMKKLVDEHLWIKRWVALIPDVVENLDLKSEEGRQLILEGVAFIRFYADKYHHAIEEDVLFKYFDEGLDILKVMHEDHEQARSHVKAIREAIDRRDKAAVVEHLLAYRDLLTDHIRKEDEILYPWMDRNLSVTQVGELFSKFSETDEQMEDVPKRYQAFIQGMEARFKH